MKYLNKLIVFSLFMLMSLSGKIAAYTFTITNQTGQDVKVRLHYAFGALNKKDELIKSFEKRKFSWKFPNPKFGLCLTKIMVSTKGLGKWVKQKQEVKLRAVTDARFNQIAQADSAQAVFVIIEDISKEGRYRRKPWDMGEVQWGMGRCGNEDFILVFDPKLKEIVAIIRF